ncbi:MAG TPA: 3-carboxy-cis,cis-muconate cycloisomerase [Telluria sp.]
MPISVFDTLLTTPEMIAVFDDAAIVGAMLRFEAGLAAAQAEEGVISAAAARSIGAACAIERFDIPALVDAARSGTLAIPLVKALTRAVAHDDPEAGPRVHWGSTSQDVQDTAMVLVTREALRLLDEGLASLCRQLAALAEDHLATPVLARTLLQPAQVTSFGFKAANWLAPLVRARARLHEASAQALQLQLGGAVGTLAVMGEAGPAVAERLAHSLGLKAPAVAWHTQRDEWVRLGMEVAILTGSLGKIAADLALMAQGEVGELAEPSGDGRGGSSAMPHKRNPVSSMIGLAAATRIPQQAATLLASMGQQHERGLGNWQAELAEWPALFLSAHGALRALIDAFAGLQVDTNRMRANIDALHGLVFAEAISIWMAGAIGRPKAYEAVERMTRTTVAQGRHLRDVARDSVAADPALSAHLDLAQLDALFDPVAATVPAQRLARRLLDHIKE